jgi:hypothetical protein
MQAAATRGRKRSPSAATNVQQAEQNVRRVFTGPGNCGTELLAVWHRAAISFPTVATDTSALPHLTDAIGTVC